MYVNAVLFQVENETRCAHTFRIPGIPQAKATIKAQADLSGGSRRSKNDATLRTQDAVFHVWLKSRL
jgi:hypothetical protein